MELSSGGVIKNNDKYLVLKYGLGHWGFVKGHVENKETMKETFLREAKEETGISKDDLQIKDGFEENIDYYYKKKGETVYKKVQYFLAESNTTKVTLSQEHDDYKWLEYEKALGTITFDNDKKVLKKAKKFLEKQ